MGPRTVMAGSAESFTAAVGEVRRARSMTQAELAEMAGIERGYLARIETGRTTRLLEHTFRMLRRMGATVTITIEEPPANHDVHVTSEDGEHLGAP